jgi:hypothetical protein
VLAAAALAASPAAVASAAPAAASAAARRAPLAAFSTPGSGPLRQLDGTVADGARGVEVALARRTDERGRCHALTATQPRFTSRADACTPIRWQPARLDDEGGAWRLRFGRALPRGRYVAWVRAVAPGTRPWPYSATGGNQVAFTLTR